MTYYVLKSDMTIYEVLPSPAWGTHDPQGAYVVRSIDTGEVSELGGSQILQKTENVSVLIEQQRKMREEGANLPAGKVWMENGETYFATEEELKAQQQSQQEAQPIGQPVFEELTVETQTDIFGQPITPFNTLPIITKRETYMPVSTSQSPAGIGFVKQGGTGEIFVPVKTGTVGKEEYATMFDIPVKTAGELMEGGFNLVQPKYIITQQEAEEMTQFKAVEPAIKYYAAGPGAIFQSTFLSQEGFLGLGTAQSAGFKIGGPLLISSISNNMMHFSYSPKTSKISSKLDNSENL